MWRSLVAHLVRDEGAVGSNPAIPIHLQKYTGMSLTILSGRYRILNVLGDGGFGKTFLVEDMQMPSAKKCVLKQLKPVHGGTDELCQLVQDRFQREAATLEMLGEEHEQIPRLYAYFSESEEFYLVQEWINGVTIAEKVQHEGRQSELYCRRFKNELANPYDVKVTAL